MGPTVLITPAYPSEAHPSGPIFRDNFPMDRPEVLAKYGVWVTTLGKAILIVYLYFSN